MDKEKFARYKEAIAKLLALKEEDCSFDWREDPPNFIESRDEHHRPKAEWPGELWNQFGQHRRGPSGRP